MTDEEYNGPYTGKCGITCDNPDREYCILRDIEYFEYFPEAVAIAQWNGLRYERN